MLEWYNKLITSDTIEDYVSSINEARELNKRHAQICTEIYFAYSFTQIISTLPKILKITKKCDHSIYPSLSLYSHSFYTQNLCQKKLSSQNYVKNLKLQ